MQSPPLLFVLDLNGTLLSRLTRSFELAARKKHPGYRPEDCRINGKPIYFRPHRLAFLKSLFQIGQVAVWTSATPKNAIPMTVHAFQGLLSKEKLEKLPGPVSRELDFHKHTLKGLLDGEHELLFLWTQLECEIVHSGYGKPNFKKHLDKIWKCFPQYGSHNTIIIDDTLTKLQNYAENVVLIPEFQIIDPTIDFERDDRLRILQNYLGALSLANCKNVQEYLRSWPVF